MPADTQYRLTARLDRQILPMQAGTFGIVNNDVAGAEIWVTLETIGQGPAGDLIYLRALGESLTIDRATLKSVTIEAKNPTTHADQYPATILLVDTDLTVSVTSLASAVAGASSSTSPFGGFSGAPKSTVVTVGTTATPLPATLLANRKACIIQAPASNGATVYIGGAAVTADAAATGGYQLAPGASLPIDLGAGVIYGRVAAGTQPIVILEFA